MKENTTNGKSHLNPDNVPPATTVPVTTPPATVIPVTIPAVPITLPPVTGVVANIPATSGSPASNSPVSGPSNTIPAQQVQPHPPHSHSSSARLAFLSAVARVTLELKHDLLKKNK